MHLVTFANLNTYPFFEQPLWELQQQNLTKEEYLTAARKLAEEKLIPKFVESLIRDLSSHGELTDLAQISVWQSQPSTNPKLEENIFMQGIVTSYGQVTSLDLSADLSADSSKELPVKTAGALMPNGWGHTYATDDMLMIAGQGWNWNVGMGGSVQTTYLHGFALRDGRATPAAVGRLEGALLDQYAVDIVDGYMRVATTIRNNMWAMVRPLNGGDVVVQEQTVPRTENYIIVLKIPALSDPSKSALLEEVGRTKSLGKDGEVITGVRFADKVAYAVTFERTDPFYVITFDDPKTPLVRGELNITGFSSHLHFINDDSTLVLGVGQEADDNGRVKGLQVTLYDARNPEDPKIIDRHNVELKDDVYSSSSAEWDYKALRYVPLGDDYGILIMPLRVDSYTSMEGNFDGFIVHCA
jgi:DNA excision repair protein ERCC-4